MHEQIIMVDGQEQPISRTYQYRKVIVNLQIKFSIFKLQTSKENKNNSSFELKQK